MKREKITFVVLRDSGSKVYQAALSKPALGVAGFLMFLVLTVFIWLAADYFQLKFDLPGNKQLQQQLAAQQEEIDSQNIQIKAFAEEINGLKSKLLALNDFENRIRIIANIAQPEDRAGLFGVGGTAPEDLDATKPLEEGHTRLVRSMHQQVAELDQASENQARGFETLFGRLEEKRHLLASTPAIRPTRGWITSRFGYRISPFTGLREIHKGMDIAARHGTPIIATADGVVRFAGPKGRLGKTLVIDHGHGITTRFGHCDKLKKKRGETVKRGDTIATVGNSGRSTGPHLHYEVRLNGVQVNPENYILDMVAEK